MIRLFLLYAILIFAKKAPKLIADLLKLDNKDGVGLKGLNIKNKMGEAALVGDKVKKGMMGLEGGAKKALGAGKQLVRDGLKKSFDPLKGTLKTAGSKMFDNLKNGDIKGAMKEGHDSIWGKDARKNNAAELGGKLKENFIDKAGANAKKVKAVGKQGFKDYKDQENTKGAHFAGRLEIDPTQTTLTQKFEAKLSKSIANSNKKAGLYTEKEKSNIEKQDKMLWDDIKLDDNGRPKTPSISDLTNGVEIGGEPFKLGENCTDKDWKEFSGKIRAKLGDGPKTDRALAMMNEMRLKQVQEDVSTYATGQQKVLELTQAISAAEAQGVDHAELDKQLEQWNKEIARIQAKGHEFEDANGVWRPLSATTIEIANQSVSNAISKNSSNLSKAEEALKPSSDGKK